MEFEGLEVFQYTGGLDLSDPNTPEWIKTSYNNGMLLYEEGELYIYTPMTEGLQLEHINIGNCIVCNKQGDLFVRICQV